MKEKLTFDNILAIIFSIFHNIFLIMVEITIIGLILKGIIYAWTHIILR